GRQGAEKFHTRGNARLRGGFLEFGTEGTVVHDPKFGLGILGSKLGESADGQMKALPMNMPPNADGAQWSGWRIGQLGKLGKILISESQLRHLFHPAGAKT